MFGGSIHNDWNEAIIGHAFNTNWMPAGDKEESSRLTRVTCASLAGVHPEDAMEGMIAAQLLAAHNSAMECYRRAMMTDQTFKGRQEALNQANKLSRTWSTLLAALDKRRGKGGQQKVTVEHFHVHQGGQAIVGNVERGGANKKCGGQSHATQNTNAPGSAMHCDVEAERVTVPSVGSER